MADAAASVLAKLKNKARAAGISYQQCFDNSEVSHFRDLDSLVD